MRKNKFLFIITIFLVLAAVSVGAILVSMKLKNRNSGSDEEPTVGQENLVTDIPEPEPGPEPEPEPEPFVEYDIHLLAVGDNLFHTGVINSGKQDDGSLNYDHEFDGILEFLEVANIKIINQETPYAGNELGFSSYPTFNTPTEVGDAVAKAGFNVVTGATNHATDKGVSGLINFYNFFKTKYPEILICGIHGEMINTILPNTVEGDEGVKVLIETDGTASDITPEEMEGAVVINDKYDYSRINLLEIEGITFAFLNYTYGNNTETYPTSQEGHLDPLCYYDPGTRALDFTKLNPIVLEDIALADTIADVVIVCPHWGVEYTTTPSVYQTTWAVEMVEAGADAIIGTHPHVVQPVEWITSPNGNEAVCYYSLGNYVSTQNQAALNMLEAMAWVTFHVTEDGVKIVREDTGVVPLVDHYTFNPLCYKHTYLLEEYTEELALSHGILGWGGIQLHLETLQKLSDDILGDSVLTKKQIMNQFN